MPAVSKHTDTVSVTSNNHKQEGMTLRDIEEFCQEARNAQFKDKDKPTTEGSHLIWSLYISRTVDVP